MYQNEIYHHGINGQKWGVRNGPPYPLKDHPRAETLSSKEINKDGVDSKKTSNKNRSSVINKTVKKNDVRYQEFIDRLDAADMKYMNKITEILDKDGYFDKPNWDGEIPKAVYQKAEPSRKEFVNASKDLVNTYLDQYGDQYLSAFIKDVGYQNTIEGKKAIEKVIRSGNTELNNALAEDIGARIRDTIYAFY